MSTNFRLTEKLIKIIQRIHICASLAFPNFNILKIFFHLVSAVLGLHCGASFSLVVVSGGYSLLWGAGFSLLWLLSVVEHGL